MRDNSDSTDWETAEREEVDRISQVLLAIVVLPFIAIPFAIIGLVELFFLTMLIPQLYVLVMPWAETSGIPFSGLLRWILTYVIASVLGFLSIFVFFKAINKSYAEEREHLTEDEKQAQEKASDSDEEDEEDGFYYKSPPQRI